MVITRNSYNIIKGRPISDRYISDHCSVFCSLSVPRPSPTVKHISFRKLKTLDLTAFKDDIARIDLLIMMLILKNLLIRTKTHCASLWIVMLRSCLRKSYFDPRFLGSIVISSKLNVNVGKQRENGELRDVSLTSFCSRKVGTM